MADALAKLMELEAAARPAAPVRTADFEGEAALAKSRRMSPAKIGAADARLAREKADFVALVRDWNLRQGISRKLAAERVAATCADRFPLLQTAGKGGASALRYTNFRHWERALTTPEGRVDTTRTTALARDYSKGRRARRGDPVFWQMFGAHYMSRLQPSMAEAYRIACRDARAAGIEDVPTREQVKYYYARYVDQASIDIARKGEEYFCSQYQYFIDRDWEAVQVFDVLFSDHHTMDCPCRVWDDDQRKWRACRPTLTAMMDAKSLYFTGWQISPGAGNNETIRNSLALSIINADMRAPLIVYCDNGADYKMRGWSEPVVAGGHEHSVLQSLGVGVINSIKYRAQAKTVERRFREVCTWFARKWAGYLGNAPGTRTEQGDYFWNNPEELPSLQELTRAFAGWLAEEYHARPSNGKILQGKTPQQAWDARDIARSAWTRDQLYEAFLLPQPTQPMVRRGPSVQVRNTVYYSEELWSRMGKSGDAGKVLVKIDPFDSSHVFCYEFDGRYICEARTRAAIKAIALDDEAERAKIGEAERHKRGQRRRAYTVVADETGGTYKLADPAERIAMLRSPQDARIERVASRRSVKGGTHNFTHYRLAQPETPETPPALPDAPADRALDFRPEPGEKRSAELEKLHDMIHEQPEPAPEADLQEFARMAAGGQADPGVDPDTFAEFARAALDAPTRDDTPSEDDMRALADIAIRRDDNHDDDDW